MLVLVCGYSMFIVFMDLQYEMYFRSSPTVRGPKASALCFLSLLYLFHSICLLLGCFVLLV